MSAGMFSLDHIVLMILYYFRLPVQRMLTFWCKCFISPFRPKVPLLHLIFNRHRVRAIDTAIKSMRSRHSCLLLTLTPFGVAVCSLIHKDAGIRQEIQRFENRRLSYHAAFGDGLTQSEERRLPHRKYGCSLLS